MAIGLGLSMIGFGAGSSAPAAPSYEAEATALFARFSTDPGSTRKDAINTCIASLKSAGVWSKLDALWVMAAHESASALLNWVSTSHDLTNTGCVFTTDVGYKGGGGGTDLKPPTSISTYTNYQQNSAHLSVWLRNNNAEGSATITAGSNVSLFPMFGGTDFYSRINNSGGTPVTVGTSAGFSLGNRSSSTACEKYRDGVQVHTESVASSSIPVAQLSLGAGLTNPQMAVVSVGGSLNNTEQLAFYNALNTLKAAIGW